MSLKTFSLRHPIALQAILLTIILLIGLGLRFWHLASKPLWLDEVLTALFTMGRSYQDIPREQFFPLTALDQLFTLQPGTTCPQISQRLVTESVHPPFFFCLMHRWLNLLKPNAENWVWVLRSLPALMGVGAIAAMYRLNRIAFSPTAGLVSAALMAVSPFAVYLSQEARHYTMPMLLITLALTALVEMQQDCMRHTFRPGAWVAWMVLNGIGLYTHYFFVLALVAQVGAIALWLWVCRSAAGGQRFSGGQNAETGEPLDLKPNGRLSLISPYPHPAIPLTRPWKLLGGAIAVIFLCYLPWLPNLIGHFGRPEADWLIPYEPTWIDRVAPLYQLVVGWVLTIIALPVENQPRTVEIGFAVIILLYIFWLLRWILKAVNNLWKSFPQRPAFCLLAGFTAGILLEFLAIVYFLDKDITVVPRYNFVYYPGACAMLGAGLSELLNRGIPQGEKRSKYSRGGKRAIASLLLVGLLSSGFVVNGWVFQKSYHPDRVAADIAFEQDKPLAMVVSYRSLQEVALGLSFALALRQTVSPESVESVQFAFLDYSQGYQQVWKTLVRLPQSLPLPLNLWVVASPGMRTDDYPQRLRLASQPGERRTLCGIDPEQFHRIGFPYQLFRCDRKRGRV
ncbi:MAG: glycosyltransferase family 39 protein [Oculatellaceae cyanobacterium Prado106]|nr:glycosyltransferase family 39 protein [Oculatellaceae cyanobacterium Prado106]